MKMTVILAAAFLFAGNATADPIRGRLANEGFENQPIKSVFFFAGNWRNGVQFYEYNPSSNIPFYTVHPSDARHLGWSESVTNRGFAVDAMINAGINVINMSYWGPRGTDNWAWWSPMQTSTYAQDELFNAAVSRNILIAPYIESTAATTNSPGFSFMDCFPGDDDNPAPALVIQINDLIDRYLLHPKKDAWSKKWAQVYDQSGNKRYVVSLIHVASNQQGVTDPLFAEGFDRVADKVYQTTNVRIGFMLDALPPGTFAGGRFKPSANQTGPWLYQQASILAIQCFIPEIWTGYTQENALVQWKKRFSKDWEDTGIPFIFDLSSGYDAHVVFPGSMIYGNTQAWRDSLSRMISNSNCQGITFNSWNGYTEGMAFMSTLQYEDDNFLWARSLFQNFTLNTEISGNPSDRSFAPALYQNYPNPFNPITTIRFSVKEPCRVVLQVFDISGREVSTVADAEFGSGEHTVRFDASRLSSGIYVYLIRMGNFIDAKKMVVLE